MRFSKFFVPIISIFPLSVSAQNLSVTDITSQIDTMQAGNNDYRALLNDPDPERARLAMKIMLEQGDAELQRIALDHGLYSTDPSVRRVALEGFLSSKPILTIRADGSGAMENDRNDLFRYVERAKGSVEGTGAVLLSYQLGDFDEEHKCFMYRDDIGGGCAFRLTEAALSMQHYGQWTEFQLDTDGVLRGPIYIYNVGVIPAEIPISK